MKEQLDQLENSVLQVLSAYSAAVRDRLSRIAADLVAELPQA